MRIPVHPDTYFYDHASNNRVTSQAQETTVHLPSVLVDWITFAKSDIPGDRHSDMHVASLAVEFGADRPLVDWGLPVGRFEDIIEAEMRMKMNESHVIGNTLFGPMNTRKEPETIRTIHLRMEQDTSEKVELYSNLLKANQSTILRHCMAISFRWYNEDVFNKDMAPAWVDDTQPYVDRFRREMEARVEYARDHLGVDGL